MLLFCAVLCRAVPCRAVLCCAVLYRRNVGSSSKLVVKHAHASLTRECSFCLCLQVLRDDYAKQRHAWASAKKTLQAQQSSLQDECNDLACQLAERDQQLRSRDERIRELKKQLEDANLAVATSRKNSEVSHCGKKALAKEPQDDLLTRQDHLSMCPMPDARCRPASTAQHNLWNTLG